MTSRYRNDYIRGISQIGTVPKSTTLVNKTSEESRARFSNIMNTLAQKHNEETYVPPVIEREPVIRDIPREINPIIETYETPQKDNTTLIVVIVVIILLLFIAYKLYTAQRLIDDIIYKETFHR